MVAMSMLSPCVWECGLSSGGHDMSLTLSTLAIVSVSSVEASGWVHAADASDTKTAPRLPCVFVYPALSVWRGAGDVPEPALMAAYRAARRWAAQRRMTSTIILACATSLLFIHP